MISLEQVLIIHKLPIEEFGGTPEVRDLEILISCLERPFQTFDGNELYPTVETKAASIILL